MKDSLSNRGLRRFYRILIGLQVVLIASSCWLMLETDRYFINLCSIGCNLLFGAWNLSILKDLKAEK